MENQYSGSERRKHKRVKVARLNVFYRQNEPLDVRLKMAEKESTASMVDISEGGISILTDINMPLRTVLTIRFTLSKFERESVGFFGRIEIVGEVRNNATVAPNSYRIGIVFKNIDEVSKREIVNFIEAFENK